MKLIYNYIKSAYIRKYFSKILWVLNNFLTMECYRKLCNRLYWKKLEPGTLPYTTRCWLIIFSAFSVIWLAFFFDPMDPTNSKSPSRLIQTVSKIFHKIGNIFTDTADSIGKSLKNYSLQISNFFSFADNILLNRTQFAYLKTSSLLI